MRILMVIGASLAGALAGAAMIETAWSQSGLRTCTDAYRACVEKTRLARECEAERVWCRKTGTFADPVTKSVSSGLRKK